MEDRDQHLLKLIWHPDIYFANARTAQFHDVTRPNFLVWIYSNGTVWYDCRISLTVLCMQNLARYPLDSQTCALRILSYAYDTQQIVIRWHEPNPIEVNSEIRMPDMRLRNIQHFLRNDTYATGVWSCALAEFHVDREIMHHIIQVSLSITTLLTLATQSGAARMALPQTFAQYSTSRDKKRKLLGTGITSQICHKLELVQIINRLVQSYFH
ncbi:Glycine receptor subunit beta-type 4 [Parelaphostrongylus tenuis]|uniref:Glycine receptor subunit beta-type 4 n=1 Tax=Parelaphostrongylus tenuis TaxID=148309 RepID=A0AAD5N7R8_PARTN|nr:Glycine receptor subunit beta-type 4 [Parelaphostrongylus tenuis]